MSAESTKEYKALVAKLGLHGPLELLRRLDLAEQRAAELESKVKSLTPRCPKTDGDGHTGDVQCELPAGHDGGCDAPLARHVDNAAYLAKNSATVAVARQLAVKFHGSQLYGERPYTVHLQDVVDMLVRFGYDSIPLLCAAWLHDTLEDTALTRGVISGDLGENVAALVWSVTDEPGKNRAERHAKTFVKTRKHGFQAVALKLADRLANVCACITTGNRGLLDMYRKEQAAFRAALYRDDDGLDAMWKALDGMLWPKTECVSCGYCPCMCDQQ